MVYFTFKESFEMILSKNTYAATWCQKGYIGIIGGGGSRKLGTGGGGGGATGGALDRIMY